MARRITLYMTDQQGMQIDNLPRKVSFSELVRNKFDIIMEDYSEDDEGVRMVIR